MVNCPPVFQIDCIGAHRCHAAPQSKLGPSPLRSSIGISSTCRLGETFLLPCPHSVRHIVSRATGTSNNKRHHAGSNRAARRTGTNHALHPCSAAISWAIVGIFRLSTIRVGFRIYQDSELAAQAILAGLSWRPSGRRFLSI